MNSKRTYGQDYSQHPDFWQDDDSDMTPAPIVKHDNFVAPAPRPTIAYPVNQPPTVIVEKVFDYGEGAKETTNSVDRATALAIRVAPFGCAWLILAVGVAWAAGDSVVGILLFATLTAATYAHLNWQEYQHSRAGLERHRIDTAAALKAQEMTQQHELRQQALQTYMRHLEVDSDD
jgi:hypothetical protein